MTSLSRTPAMAKAAPPMRRVGLVVGAREPDGHRVAGRPRGDVQAHERLARGAQVLAERRPRGLRGAQVGLGQQRDVLERTRAGQALAVEGRAALQVGELGSQRRGIGHARTLADPRRDGPPARPRRLPRAAAAAAGPARGRGRGAPRSERQRARGKPACCLLHDRHALRSTHRPRPTARAPAGTDSFSSMPWPQTAAQRRRTRLHVAADPQRDGPPGGRPVVAMLRGECRVRWRRGAEPARFLTSYDASYAGRFPPSSALRTILASARRMRRLSVLRLRRGLPRRGLAALGRPCRACARTWR